MNKFDWLASESGPKNFPMQVVHGCFYYVDGGKLYVPDGKTLYSSDWGTSVSTDIVGPDLKPLPNRLEILFFSYTEDQFYKGNFDLPYDKILSLFREGSIDQQGNREAYDKIVAGITPGGAVAVWLEGGKTVEVFYGHAEKSDEPWSLIIDNPRTTREGIIKIQIEHTMTPEGIKTLQKEGIPYGRWDRDHKRYLWKLVYTGTGLKNILPKIRYVNGEFEFINEQTFRSGDLKAVPKFISYYRKSTKELPGVSFTLYPDDQETYEAFEVLTSKQQFNSPASH